MATKTLNYTNLVNTYTPATGYMMIGLLPAVSIIMQRYISALGVSV